MKNLHILRLENVHNVPDAIEKKQRSLLIPKVLKTNHKANHHKACTQVLA